MQDNQGSLTQIRDSLDKSQPKSYSPLEIEIYKYVLLAIEDAAKANIVAT